MPYLKKGIIATAMLSGHLAYAGTMGTVCTEGNVTMPCPNRGWEIGAQALYLQPIFNSLYAWDPGSNANSIQTVSAAGKANRIDSSNKVPNSPSWAWGFEIEGAYKFDTGNDVNLNWYHLTNKSTTFLSDDEIESISLLRPENDLRQRHFTITPSWEAVNLELGQRVNLGPTKNLRFHGGFQYARIKSTEVLSEVGRDLFLSDGSLARLNSIKEGPESHTFNGFGPRAGVDLSYDAPYAQFYGLQGLQLYGTAAAALLCGTAKYSVALFENYSADSVSYITRHYNGGGSRIAMVPEIEGKVGLSINRDIYPGNLAFDVGYMWLNYFNPIVTDEADSNFGLQGVFFGLKWLGNM